MEKKDIIFLIIAKLIRMDKWGGAHTEVRNLTRGLPQRYASSNKGKKLIQQAIKDLVNYGFLFVKISTKEQHCSLNPKKAKEILQFYEKYKITDSI